MYSSITPISSKMVVISRCLIGFPLFSLFNPPHHDFFFFSFWGHTQGIWKFLGLGVESELQLLAYATATAMWNPSRICDLRQSSGQLFKALKSPIQAGHQCDDRSCTAPWSCFGNLKGAVFNCHICGGGYSPGMCGTE